MPKLIDPLFVMFLGDSLTHGVAGKTDTWVNMIAVDPRIYPRIIVGNSGATGNKVEDMTVRYEANLKLRGGIKMIGLMAPINNILQGDTDVQAFTKLKALADEIVADGILLLLLAQGPFKAYAGPPGWDSTKQGYYVSVHEQMQAYAAANPGKVFFATPYPKLGTPANASGAGSPADPDALWPIYNQTIIGTDGLHWGDDGELVVAEVVIEELLQIFPPPSVQPAVFGQPKELLLKLGDELPPLGYQLVDRLGAPVPIGAGSVAFVLTPAAGGSPTSLPCVVLDADAAKVELDWPNPLGLTVGDYLGSFVLTAEAPSDRPCTFPYGRSIVVRVY